MIERLKELFEQLRELLAGIAVLTFLALLAFGGFWWAVDSVLPVRWSHSVHDVFTNADQKRKQADELSKLAAPNRAEADRYLKELHPPNSDSASALSIEIYIESLIEIRDLYQVSEALEDRATELRRKAAAQ